MKAYKLKEDYNQTFKKGRIAIKYDTSDYVLLATPSQPTRFGVSINTILDKCQEVELENEKWVHPHLYKKLKINLSNQLQLS